MIERTGSYREAVVELAARSGVAAPEQIAALAAELAKPEYDGLDRAAAYRLLCRARTVPNPEPQGRVARAEWLPDELRNALLQMVDEQGASAWLKLELLRESPNHRFRALGIQALATFGLQAISIANPLIAAGFEMLVEAMVITEDQWAWLTTEPDPAWRADVTTPAPSDAILGTDNLPDPSEFAAAWSRAGRA